MKDQSLCHQVIFTLCWPPESVKTRRFLQDGRRILTAIPGVENFYVFRQVSPKNDFHFGFSMEFANRAVYKAYNDHPDHIAFVEERWKTEVTHFLEIDLEEMGF